MTNPNGPYPGRQLFLGRTSSGDACLAYLITGRSPASRERKAVLVGNGIRIGPVGNAEYDPLRHYTGIEWDNATGLATVTNGIQTEAIFETYKLLFNLETAATPDYMGKILDGAKAEPDSYHTPRIAGVISGAAGDRPTFIIGIKTEPVAAKTHEFDPKPGMMTGVSVYSGSLENPGAFDLSSKWPTLSIKAKTAKEIADYLYELSDASYQGNDIRVCAVGGIFDRNARKWEMAFVNKNK